MAAGDFDHLAGQHPCLLAGKKQNGFGDVLWLDQLSHRDQWNDYLLKFRIDPSGLGGTGSNTVDGNAILCHFQGKSQCSSGTDAPRIVCPRNDRHSVL